MSIILYIIAGLLTILFILLILIPFIFGLFGGANLIISNDNSNSANTNCLINLIEEKVISFNKMKVEYLEVGNFEKIQEINTELLWLDVINEFERKKIFTKEKINYGFANQNLIQDFDLLFPGKFEFKNPMHFTFAQLIIQGYRNVLANSTYAFYKPNRILPYPKKLILKSILFISDSIQEKDNNYSMVSIDDEIDNLGWIKSFLYINFIDDSSIKLPENGIENYSVGQKLLTINNKESISEEALKDWL